MGGDGNFGGVGRVGRNFEGVVDGVQWNFEGVGSLSRCNDNTCFVHMAISPELKTDSNLTFYI